MNEWMNECMNEWMNGCSEFLNELRKKWIYIKKDRIWLSWNKGKFLCDHILVLWINDRTNEWINEWMNEWINEWTNEWTNEWINK